MKKFAIILTAIFFLTLLMSSEGYADYDHDTKQFMSMLFDNSLRYQKFEKEDIEYNERLYEMREAYVEQSDLVVKYTTKWKGRLIKNSQIYILQEMLDNARNIHIYSTEYLKKDKEFDGSKMMYLIDSDDSEKLKDMMSKSIELKELKEPTTEKIKMLVKQNTEYIDRLRNHGTNLGKAEQHALAYCSMSIGCDIVVELFGDKLDNMAKRFFASEACSRAVSELRNENYTPDQMALNAFDALVNAGCSSESEEFIKGVSCVTKASLIGVKFIAFMECVERNTYKATQ